MRRAILLLLLCSLLALTWWRSPEPHVVHDPYVGFTLVETEKLKPLPDGLILQGAWQLQGRDDHFGGYSALVYLGKRRFLAGSDRGRQLQFTDPSREHPKPEMGWLAPNPNQADKADVDIESLTYDPESGQVWAGYEYANAIERLNPDLTLSKRVTPPAMRDWPGNGGPEAMVRLKDGRFIVLAETRSGWLDTTGPGLLFPRDPISGVKPIAFRFAAPPGYLATDMTELPDGRVLILARRLLLPFPLRFSAKLILADPADIADGRRWSGKEIARLDGSVPMDNYEGITIVPLADGAVNIWLISDDNTSALQRTLLLKLRWTPPPIAADTAGRDARKKARRDTARLR